MPHELSNVSIRDIDVERGVMNVSARESRIEDANVRKTDHISRNMILTVWVRMFCCISLVSHSITIRRLLSVYSSNTVLSHKSLCGHLSILFQKIHQGHLQTT